MNNSCEVCKKKIVEPLYWADPKFYDCLLYTSDAADE